MTTRNTAPCATAQRNRAKPGSLRAALLSSAVGAGLLMAGSPAHALSTTIGEVQIFFDTTISAGLSMRTQDGRSEFLAEFNGGTRDLREADPNATILSPSVVIPGIGALVDPNPVTGVVGNLTFTDDVPQNFDDSPNTDDRFLNFGAGDLISGNIKATSDLQVNWRNFTLFTRATGFYDAVLDNSGSYNNFGLSETNRDDAGRNIKLLDLYLSADFEAGNLPVNFRAGKQVISWGEGTFILNGINVINPIDVNAFRRPGAEIKEGLIPVWALYGSVGLPFDLSLEGFYQLDQEPFQLDVAGTPFAGSDVAKANAEPGGNQGIGFYSGSIRNGYNLRDCTGTGATAQLAAALNGVTGGASLAGYNSLVGTGCNTLSSRHFLTDLPTNGDAQQLLLSNLEGDPNSGSIDLGNASLLGTARGDDDSARDGGQWGLALRYYSEALNSTEFGLYYMNYHSRLPIAQVESLGVPQVQITAESPGTSASKLPGAVGCLGADGTGGLLIDGEFRDPSLQAGGLASTLIVSDPNATAAALAPTAAAVLGGAAAAAAGAGNLTAAAGLGAAAAEVGALAASPNSTSVAIRTLSLINCGIRAGTQVVTPAAPIPLLPDGTETIVLQQNLQTRLIYPEDIDLFGFSFNTTIGDWGVQGEFSYRDNQPLQVETTQQTISAAGSQCVGLVGFGDANTFILSQLSTEPGTQANLAAGESACNTDDLNFGDGNGLVPRAFVREEVYTVQIGTTATFTNSNPLIGFLGADIGILVTEIGMVHIPDVPADRPVDGGSGTSAGTVKEENQLSELCRSGTALPLGAILNLDTRDGCNPTKTSSGGVLLSRLDYNNAFGSAWTISPQVAFRYDFSGRTPAPLGNYLANRRSVGLSLTANLQNVWTLGLNYTNFMGPDDFQQDLDDDFIGLTASYSF